MGAGVGGALSVQSTPQHMLTHTDMRIMLSVQHSPPCSAARQEASPRVLVASASQDALGSAVVGGWLVAVQSTPQHWLAQALSRIVLSVQQRPMSLARMQLASPKGLAAAGWSQLGATAGAGDGDGEWPEGGRAVVIETRLSLTAPVPTLTVTATPPTRMEVRPGSGGACTNPAGTPSPIPTVTSRSLVPRAASTWTTAYRMSASSSPAALAYSVRSWVSRAFTSPGDMVSRSTTPRL